MIVVGFTYSLATTAVTLLATDMICSSLICRLVFESQAVRINAATALETFAVFIVVTAKMGAFKHLPTFLGDINSDACCISRKPSQCHLGFQFEASFLKQESKSLTVLVSPKVLGLWDGHSKIKCIFGGAEIDGVFLASNSFLDTSFFLVFQILEVLGNQFLDFSLDFSF